MTPNLADIAAAPLTAHYTTVAPGPGYLFSARCLCGWSGEWRASASAAWQDAHRHEDGRS